LVYSPCILNKAPRPICHCHCRPIYQQIGLRLQQLFEFTQSVSVRRTVLKAVNHRQRKYATIPSSTSSAVVWIQAV